MSVSFFFAISLVLSDNVFTLTFLDHCATQDNIAKLLQPLSQGSLLSIGQVGENPGNKVEVAFLNVINIMHIQWEGWGGGGPSEDHILYPENSCHENQTTKK